MNPTSPRSAVSIFLFWVPLAATWVMMALEGPFLAAVIARLADPEFNLAAYGVAFAIGILVEAPVIMLMSASTALVEDRDSYRKLRAFSALLIVVSTAALALVLVPGVYDLLMRRALGLPPEVSALTYGALWLLAPWPAAIGYRRFYQGLLIRSGRTRLVAVGTVLRLGGMAAAAIALYRLTDIPGAWVGTGALSAGVTIEAIAARLMARRTVRELLEGPELARPEEGPARYSDMAAFYFPLALTSVIGLAVLPMLTFFMGRAPMPVESLAVFPVVNALSFLFRALGLSFQEAAIALLGRRNEHYPEIRRFTTGLALAATAAYALIVFTPLADVWFVAISGLSPRLADFALPPAQILIAVPALSVLLSLQRAVLVQDRRTRPVTVSTAVEVAGVAIAFTLVAAFTDLVGVTVAAVAFTFGRLMGVGYLVPPVGRAVR